MSSRGPGALAPAPNGAAMLAAQRTHRVDRIFFPDLETSRPTPTQLEVHEYHAVLSTASLRKGNRVLLKVSSSGGSQTEQIHTPGFRHKRGGVIPYLREFKIQFS